MPRIRLTEKVDIAQATLPRENSEPTSCFSSEQSTLRSVFPAQDIPLVKPLH